MENWDGGVEKSNDSLKLLRFFLENLEEGSQTELLKIQRQLAPLNFECNCLNILLYCPYFERYQVHLQEQGLGLLNLLLIVEAAHGRETETTKTDGRTGKERGERRDHKQVYNSFCFAKLRSSE